MSAIDRREAQMVVEAQFDHKEFSKGVDDTLKDLDRFNKGLQFENGVKGLNNLQTVANGINFDAIQNGIQSISSKLSYLESFGFQIFHNLSQSAINWGKNMANSFTTAQVKGGWHEYELKMDSVKTIMNSTGESLETVNDYLEKLNKYADQTIYSFSDMTANIGKFTNAGVKLDKAVRAIQGVSNAAAVAGADANQASRAMYNFAQALSSGAVKLIDWRSIENANMATKEFKEQLLKNALALGTVVKEGDKYVSTTTDAAGNTSDAFDATSNFNESLSSLWMTTDVLTKTLGDYADETTKVGKKAFAAAQEVSTVSKMMDALKESVGSGWAQSFEIVFGNLTEATKLWTKVNDVISGFIQRIADTRNGILKLWAQSGAKTQMAEAISNILQNIGNVLFYIGLALETLFGHRYLENFDALRKSFGEGFKGNLVIIKHVSDFLIVLSYRLNQLTQKLMISTPTLEKIYQCTQAILIPLRMIGRIVKGIGTTVGKTLLKSVAKTVYTIIDLISMVGYKLTEGEGQFKLYEFADKVVKTFNNAFGIVTRNLKWFSGQIAHVFGFKNAIDGVYKLSGMIATKLVAAVKKLNDFGPTFMKVINFVRSFVKAFEFGFLDALTAMKSFFTEENGGFTKLKTQFQNVINYIKKITGEGTKLGNVIKTLSPKFTTFGQKLKDFFTNNMKLTDIGKLLGSMFVFGSSNPFVQLFSSGLFENGLKGFVEKAKELLKTKFEEITKYVDLGPYFTTVKTKAEDFYNSLKEILEKIKTKIESIKETIDKHVDLKGFFEDAKEAVENFAKSLGKSSKDQKKEKKSVKQTADKVKDYVDAVSESVKENVHWDNVLETVCQGLLNVHDYFEDIDELKMDNVFGKVSDKLQEFSKNLKDFSTQKPTKEMKNFGGSFDDTRTAVDKVSEALRNNPIFQTISKAVTTVIDLVTNSKVAEFIMGAIEKITSGFETVYTYLQNDTTLQSVEAAVLRLKDNLSSVDWTTISSSLSGLVGAVREFIREIDAIKYDKLEEFRGKINGIFNDLENNFDQDENSTVFTKALLWMARIAQSLVNGFIYGMESSLENFIQTLQAMAGFYILTKIFGFLTDAGKTAGGVVGALGHIYEAISSFAGVITMTKWQIAANALLTAAKAVGYLTLSLLALSGVDERALMTATGALGALILCLTLLASARGALASFGAKKAASEATAKAAEASVASTVGTADVIKSGMSNLADVVKAIGNSLLIAIKESLKFTGIGIMLFAFGFTVSMLVACVNVLGQMDDHVYQAGLMRGAGLILAIGIFMKEAALLTNTFNAGKIALLGVALVTLGLAISIFAIGCVAIASLPLEKLVGGLLMMGGGIVLLTMICEQIQATINGPLLAQAAGGLLTIALALTAFVVPLALFTFLAASPNFGQAIAAFLLFIGALAGLVAATAYLQGFSFAIATFGAMATSILAISAAFLIFAGAMYLLGQCGDKLNVIIPLFLIITTVIAGFLILLATLGPAAGAGISAIGMGVMTLGIGIAAIGAGIFLVMAAFVMFTNALNNFTAMTWEQAQAFANSIGMFVFALVSGITQAIIMAIVAFLDGLNKGLEKASEVLPGLIFNLLVTILRAIGAIFAAIIQMVGEFLSYMGIYLEENFPVLKAKVGMMLVGALTELLAIMITGLGKFVGLFGPFGEEVKGVLEQGAKDLKQDAQDWGNNLVEEAEKKVAEKKSELGDTVKDTLDQKEAIKEAQAENATAAQNGANETKDASVGAFQMMSGAMNGNVEDFTKLFDMSPQISNNLGLSQDAITDGTAGLVSGFTGMMSPANGELAATPFFEGMGVATEKGVGDLATKIDTGMDDVENAFNMDTSDEAYNNMFGYSEDLFANSNYPLDSLNDLGIDMGDTMSDYDFSEAGLQNMIGYSEDGISANGIMACDAGGEVASDTADAIAAERPKWEGSGGYLCQGLATGIRNNKGIVTHEAMIAMRETIDAMKAEAAEASPSKKTFEMGKFLMIGGANGIIKNAKTMVKAAVSAMRGTVDGMQTGAEGLDIGLGEIDYNPTITPVLDISRIQNGITTMRSLMAGNMTQAIGANLSVGKVDVGTAVGDLSAITTQGNSDLLSAIQRQNDELARLNYNLENQKIYLDGNTLVGKTVARMDQALGRRAVMAGGRR